MSGTITLASTGPNGQGNSSPNGFSLSADGTKVAFESLASDLVEGDTNGNSDVFVKDLATGSLVLASAGPNGQGNSGSSNPSLSADGTKIAFISFASNLVAGDTNGQSDVFVKDLVTGAVTLASTGTQGDPISLSLSADGSKVAFKSIATIQSANGTTPTISVFVKDIVTTVVTGVDSVSVSPRFPTPPPPSLSADGTKIAFGTFSSLVAGDRGGSDVYVRDLASGAVTLASAGLDGQAIGVSFNSSLSADGTKVAFDNNASNVVAGDTNGSTDVFVKDLATGAVTLASTGPDGQGNGNSFNPSLSADGTKIAFSSLASNLVAGDTNGSTSDVFVKDLVTGMITLASTGSNGQGNGGSSSPSLSADGTKVAFLSSASNLVADDTNGSTSDVFVKDLSIPVNTTTIGSGSDSLVLRVSQDAYQGSAQYTVSVDGAQVGDTLTASALHGAGSDIITVGANLAPGPHEVRLTFLNDAYGGTPATDRNLYLDGATYNGATVPGAEAVLYSAGPAVFGITDNTPLPSGVATTIGSGSDSLVLRVSQDAYQGSAQYTVSVDGAQVGDTLTASALHGAGSDIITVGANLAPGAHEVRLTFLNDAYGGTPATDRNLYLDGATYNGATVPGAEAVLYSAGPAVFGITDNTPAPSGVATTIGSGSDSLVLRVSQDAYQGSAQYTVSVDGAQVGGTLTASALHGAGSDIITVGANLVPGTHEVRLTFLNDAYGGTPATDRNLYLDGATYNGATVPGAQAVLYSAGPAVFGITDVMG
jgi:Tol biopolymer transport system component